MLHKPPWQQKIFSSMMAAIGRQLKQSVKVFQSFMLNLRLPKENEMGTNDHTFIIYIAEFLHPDVIVKLNF